MGVAVRAIILGTAGALFSRVSNNKPRQSHLDLDFGCVDQLPDTLAVYKSI